MDNRYYPGVEADAQQLVTELRNLFDADYEVQTMQVSQTTVLQARKSSTLRDITGLSSALTIKITPEHGGTRVEIGMQKWFDKAAVAAVAVFLSAALTIKITSEHGGTRVEVGMQKWFDKAAVAAAILVIPGLNLLLALPALGAYWQHKLGEDAWKIIESHIARKAGGYVPPLPGRCGTCGSANTSGSAFCSTCGADMRVGRSCNSCGAEQRDSAAKFCNRCGKPLAG